MVPVFPINLRFSIVTASNIKYSFRLLLKGTYASNFPIVKICISIRESFKNHKHAPNALKVNSQPRLGDPRDVAY